MSATVQCPSCGKSFSVSEALLGKTAKCKQCGEPFLLEANVNGGARSTAGSRTGAAASTEIQSATAASTKKKAGDLLSRFEVRGKLGAGAFGTVYRAYDPQLDREIALKVPQAGVLDSPKRIERFLREAKAAAQLRHPNIVPIYDAGQDGDQYFIASAFIKGEPLSTTVEDGGIDFRRAATIVCRLAEALGYAHTFGIVHRDIKPANVMLDEEEQPHLMDFGLASRTDSTEKLTHEGAVMGTPAYMAPEQAAGQKGDAQPASDQYSLGVVLYELLTGKTPFEGPPQVVLYSVINDTPLSPRKLRRDIPLDLETICLKAMAKEPERRYQDCQVLADDLRRWLEGEPITARRPGFGERLVRWCKREPKLALSGAFMLIGLIAAAVALSLLANHLQAEWDSEKLAKQKSDAELADEKDGHDKSKDTLFDKQMQLAQSQVKDDQLLAAIRTLEGIPLARRTWEWKILMLAAQGSPEMMRLFQGPGASVVMMAFSADSQKLWAADFRGQSKTWDLATGIDTAGPKPTLNNGNFPHPVEFAYSGDASRLVWVKLGETRGPGGFEARDDDASDLRLAFARDNFLALQEVPPPPKGKPAGPKAKAEKKPIEVILVDKTSGKELSTFELPPLPWGKLEPPVPVRPRFADGHWAEFTLNHDGSQLAIMAASHGEPAAALKIFDTQKGQEVASIAGPFEQHWMHLPAFGLGNGRLVFSPDGQYLARIARGTEKSGESIVYKEVSYAVTKMVKEKRPDGTFVDVPVQETYTKKVAVNEPVKELVVKVWDAKSGKEVLQRPVQQSGMYRLAFTPDGKRLFFGNGDGAWAWDIPDGQETFKFQSHPGGVLAFGFSPDGKRVVTGRGESQGCDGCIEPAAANVWDAVTGKLLLSLQGPVDRLVWMLLFSPDGKHLAAASNNNPNVVVWSAVDGRLIYPFDGHGAPVSSVAFSPDGKFLASFSDCNQLGMVLDGHTGKKLTALERSRSGFGHGTVYYGGLPRQHQDDVFLVSHYRGGYGAHGGMGGGGCIGFAFTPDSRFLHRPSVGGAACYGPATAANMLWQRDTGKLVTRPKNVGTVLAYSPDGTHFIAVPPLPEMKGPIPFDKLPYARMYQGEDKELFELKGLRESPSTTFSANGKLVTSMGGEQRAVTVRVCRFVEEEVKKGKKVVKIKKAVYEDQQKMQWVQVLSVWDAGTGKKVLDVDNIAPQTAMSPDGQYLAVTSPFPQPRPVRKRTAGDEPDDMEPPEPPPPPVEVRIWSIAARKQIQVLKGFSSHPQAMQFSPDGKTLVTFVAGRTEHVPVQEKRVKEENGKQVEYTVTIMKVITTRSMLKAWEASSGRELLSREGVSGTFAFSRDGSRLAVAQGPAPGESPMGAPVPGGAPMPAPAATVVSIPSEAGEFHLTAALQEKIDPIPPPKEAPVKKQSPKTAPKIEAPKALPKAIPQGEPPVLMPGEPPAAGPQAPLPPDILVFNLRTGQQVHVLQGHTEPIHHITFSPDGESLASANCYGGRYMGHGHGRGYGYGYGPPPGRPTIKIWNAKSGKEIVSFQGHDCTVNCLAFSPDGGRLASASDDGTVKIWRLDLAGLATLPEEPKFMPKTVEPPPPIVTPKQATPKPAPKKVNLPVVEATLGEARLRLLECPGDLAFMANRALLYPCGAAQALLVWEVPSGKLQRVIKGAGGMLAASGDGSRCAMGDYEGKLTVYDTADWKALQSWKTGMDGGRLQMDEQGKRVMHAAFGSVKIWSSEGKLLRESAGPYVAALSRDGRRVALAAGQEGPKAMPPPKKAEKTASSTAEQHLVAFVQDDKVKPERGIKIVDVDSGAVIKKIDTSRNSQWLALRPDGKMVAAADDKTLSLWDVETGKEVHQQNGFGKGIFGLRFTSDGKTLSIGGVPSDMKRHVHLIDVATGNRRHEIDGFGALMCDFSSDGKTIAIAGADQKLRLWDVATGKQIVPPADDGGPLFALQGSPDGKSLLLAGKDHTIRRWDVASKSLTSAIKLDLNGIGKQLPSPEGIKKQPRSPQDDELAEQAQRSPGIAQLEALYISGEFSADGSVLAITSSQPLKLVDVATGQVTRSLDLGPGHGFGTAVSGGKLASIGPRQTSHVWDLASNSLQTLKAPGPVFNQLLSPDGQRLAAYCGGKTEDMIIFDAVSGTPIHKLPSPGPKLPPFSRSLAFSADGKWLATSHMDGAIKVWDVNTGKERLALARPASQSADGQIHDDGGPSHALFRADGKVLYTVGRDATLRIWDLDQGKETAAVPLGIQATGGSTRMCFVGPDRVACLNALGTVTVVRLTGGSGSDPPVASKKPDQPVVEAASPKGNLAYNPGDKKYPRASASFTSGFDKVQMVNDGIVSYEPSPHNRWTSYGSPNAVDWLEIDFGQEKRVGRLVLHLYDDGGGVQVPAAYKIQYWDGASWRDVAAQKKSSDVPSSGMANTATFVQVQASKVRLEFTHRGESRSGVTEVEVWER